jgi:hypothetical protein
MPNGKNETLYRDIPDDVYRIIAEEQARLKIALKKHVSVSYVITSLIRKTRLNG